MRALTGVGVAVALIAGGVAWFLAAPPDARGLTPGSQCPVHAVPFREEVVPIVYGLTVDPFWDARDEQFPYANTELEGGCIGGEESEALVKYCEACRRAQDMRR